MAKRVVIFGTCGADVDPKALKAVVRFVSDTQPDEIVCTAQSIPLLEGLRDVYNGPVAVHTSNLESRFGATALSESGYHRIAPGWISTAKEDCVEASRIPGNTALKAAKKYGSCVVLGHTGRQGIASYTTGYSGNISRTVTGMEVGNLVDRKLARSLENGQQGFGLLTIDGQDVKPEIVPIIRGRFTVDGEVWEV